VTEKVQDPSNSINEVTCVTITIGRILCTPRLLRFGVTAVNVWDTELSRIFIKKRVLCLKVIL